MRRLNSRKQRGDTIVEVLIAIAIASLTLAGAYTSVNRSSNATRTAQERGEALKWAETQVEQIKASKDDLALNGANSFCFDQAQNLKLRAAASDTPCVSGTTVQYKALITQSNTNRGNFSVVVAWDALDSGVGTNRVELGYMK